MRNEKKLPKFRLDLISPTADRLALLNYGSALLGINRKKLLKVIVSNEKFTPHQETVYRAIAALGFNEKLIDTGRQIQRIYGFKNKEIAEKHFTDAQETANNFIFYLADLYGLDLDRFGFKDEVKNRDTILRRMLAYLNPFPNKTLEKGTDARTRFEELRELFIVDLALRGYAKSTIEDPLTKISDLQQEFNNTLYLGQAGSGKSVVFNVKYGQGNTALNVTRTNKHHGAQEKVESMREIMGKDGKIRLVKVDFDEKEGLKKILKLMADFYEKNIMEFDPDGLNPNGTPLLEDRYRFSVSVYGNNSDIQSVYEEIVPYFNNVKDKPINNDHGQNSPIKKRVIADYKGIPFEIVFYDQKGLLNSEKQIGKIQEIKINVKIAGEDYPALIHLPDGSGHIFYEMRKALSLLFLMYPYEIYKKYEGQTKNEYINEMIGMIEKKANQIITNLRN